MTEAPQAKLAENIMHFARVLRQAGLPVGPASVLDAIDAAQSGSLARREDFYWTLHAILVKRREHKEVFDQAFHVFWKKPKMLEQLMKLMFHQIARAASAKARDPGFRRLAEALFDKIETDTAQQNKREVLELDATLTASTDDILRKKDFEQMTLSEQVAAKQAIAALRPGFRRVRTRRFTPALRGTHIDLRRSLQKSLRAGGDVIPLAWRKPQTRIPPLVVLCDISGSCSSYSRLFLHFIHALSTDRARVRVFLFGTRLTNVTRELARRDVDEAMARVSGAVQDWSGGTRIGTALEVFNKQWGRRVLTQGAEVLLMTDGLERDSTEVLEREMQRLRRSAKHIVWLNPLLRYDRFEAKAAGIRVMMRYVDEFRAVHSLDSLADLAAALVGRSSSGHAARQWRQGA
jgi:uncharacterized protein with von Willebrand factor type A (vWA) domain